MALIGFTRKADYGLVLLSELARKGKGGVVSVGDMVKRNNLPRAFMAQIGKQLAAAGVVGSKEGKNGGYFLKEEPKMVMVKAALEAIDGKISPVMCISHPGKCPVEKYCSQKKFARRLTSQVEEIMGSYTLADLVD